MKFLVKTVLPVLGILCCCFLQGSAQTHSVARQWNEVLLEAIRADISRPTVHARNLFHTSVAMYDAWAAYDHQASTYLLGHNFRSFYCSYNGIPRPENVDDARSEAISYAAFRLLQHRFQNSPGAERSQVIFRRLMDTLGYDPAFTSTDYSTGSPAALGNYIAKQLIEMGMRDGSNELNDFRNRYYAPVNPVVDPRANSNHQVVDPNRWQPLGMENMTGQGGQRLSTPPPFLSPEWGKVIPFALQQDDLKIYQRRGYDYWVYHDPGPPPQLGAAKTDGLDDYTWNFVQVSLWASFMDPGDGSMIDISPASNGNVQQLPASSQEYRDFYKLEDGKYFGAGYAVNPKTGESYQPQLVPRGDFARVLAEFWADGPNSETPPGHWYAIFNYVSDHPLLEKRLAGKGDLVNDLEWDIKGYLALGGALHDAAITAWGIKGYYDYVRPVTAIKAMASKGQRSDPALPNYHPEGLPLIEGFIELIKPGDSLAMGDLYVNELKLYTWKGSLNYSVEQRHKRVDWIRATQWLPYQPPTFVTPPFAGYISGHSTFSRAAAQILTLFTGDEYFPGGMSEFKAEKYNYLEFEDGPSVDLVLQWAKYKDASDQCSLSRIWGGIHPPADDIPGRIIGEKIGTEAYALASRYFEGQVPAEVAPEKKPSLTIFPNPLSGYRIVRIKPEQYVREGNIRILDSRGQHVLEYNMIHNTDEVIVLDLSHLAAGLYIVSLESPELTTMKKLIIQ